MVAMAQLTGRDLTEDTVLMAGDTAATEEATVATVDSTVREVTGDTVLTEGDTAEVMEVTAADAVAMVLTVGLMAAGMVPMVDIGSGRRMVELTRPDLTDLTAAGTVLGRMAGVTVDMAEATAASAVMVANMEVVLRPIANTPLLQL
jgi:hypothetical protein